ncbi:MAG TPA: ketoacyl-ACP synthase III [Clostridiaceae bacterium]|nr:ketoacyl-ACP synthase III [Clostridiaceae bacterium]
MKTPYKILGTGSYLPELVVDNEMLAQIMDTSDEWITTRTGISRRHYCVTETTSDMAVNAAGKAIEMAEIDPENIDFIIATTLSADYTTPSMATIVQAQVGAKNAFCFDLNAACTGFVQAFDIAMRYLNTDERKTGLIVSSESLTKLVDFEDRRTCVLFGDGAGAAIVSNRHADGSDLPEANIYESFMGADGTGGEYMTGKAFERARHPFVPEDMVFEPDRFGHETGIYLSMKGPEVYRFATTAMPLAVEKAVERANLPLEAIDYIVPHQANDRILQASAKRLGIPTEKMISYIAETGNTSSASIPICLDKEVRSGHIRRGHTLVFTGFGGGLTYGACVCIF